MTGSTVWVWQAPCLGQRRRPRRVESHHVLAGLSVESGGRAGRVEAGMVPVVGGEVRCVWCCTGKGGAGTRGTITSPWEGTKAGRAASSAGGPSLAEPRIEHAGEPANHGPKHTALAAALAHQTPGWSGGTSAISAVTLGKACTSFFFFFFFCCLLYSCFRKLTKTQALPHCDRCHVKSRNVSRHVESAEQVCRHGHPKVS